MCLADDPQARHAHLTVHSDHHHDLMEAEYPKVNNQTLPEYREFAYTLCR